MDYIEQLMEQKAAFKKQMNKARNKDKNCDPKMRQKIANFLVKDQMGVEPTPAQVAYKAANFISEIVNSDTKNIFALTNLLQQFEDFYRSAK